MLPKHSLAVLSTVATAALCFISTANAHVKTFNVVAIQPKIDSTIVTVQVGANPPVPLKQKLPGEPFWTTDLEVGTGDIQYKYIVDGKPEKFSRTLAARQQRTFNDFFEREHTLKPINHLPWAFQGQPGEQWTRSSGQVNVFNETYIPTIHLSGPNVNRFFRDASVLKDAIQKTKTMPDMPMDMMIVLQNEVHKFVNVGAMPTNTRFNKFQIRIRLPRKKDGKKKKFYGRDTFKLRPNENDPTFIREKLYSDILHSIGAPTHQTTICRVYANGKAAGLFMIEDQVGNKNFVKQMLYGNQTAKPKEVGTVLDATHADLDLSNPLLMKGYKVKPKKTGSNSKLVRLAHALNRLDVSDVNAVERFDNQWLNLDVLFKGLAMEYLTAHWDGYWFYTSNYVLVDDPSESTATTHRFYFVTQDLDMTFGAHMGDKYKFGLGRDYIYQSYKSMVGRIWNLKGPDDDGPHRVIPDRLLSSNAPFTKKRFEKILATIVEKTFNPATLNLHIDSLASRYREEVAWDRQVYRLYQKPDSSIHKKDFKFSVNDMFRALDRSLGPERGDSTDYGLKEFIKLRSAAVASEFKIKLPRSPLPQGYVVPSNPPVDLSNFIVPTVVVALGKEAAVPVTTVIRSVEGPTPKVASLKSSASSTIFTFWSAISAIALACAVVL